MRFKLAGFILLCVCATALAQAPAEGDVESIGFDGYYRPSAVIPMKLRLRPKIGTPQTYKLAILQEDMDRDRVLYSRPFTLNGNPEGGHLEEKVWVYFLPQPRELSQVGSIQDLNNLIRIFLCKENGEQLVQIPIPPGTPQLKNLDQGGLYGISRGTRFVLMVGTSQSRPFRTVYEKARGITEEVLFQPITVAELPENVLGYQAVDAILWLNGDPTTLNSNTAAAVRDFVRDGKQLVVGQNPQTWQKMLDSELAEMLPAIPTGVEEETGLLTLRKLAGLPLPGKPAPVGSIWRTPSGGTIDPWPDTPNKPFPIVRATPRAGAFVPLWQLSDPTSPYLARQMYGLGSVTWVAQDFGDPTILSREPMRHLGWARIWDKTFDWRNDTINQELAGLPNTEARLKEAYELVYREANSRTDLGASLLAGMEAPSTGAAYVALAIVFFIGYWLLAGPGTYFFLLSRKKAHYSWVVFAAAAVAATALTVLVVRIILRGPPDLYHVTFVRVGPDQEAVAHSQFGLYVKSDGLQHITLKDTDPKRASYLMPYPAHPDHLGASGGFTAYLEYEVPMRDRNATDAPAINVPYRSTIKKLQARWIGKLPATLEGQARLGDAGLSGKLRNNTGRHLHNVHMFYLPSPERDDDMTIYIPDTTQSAAWPAGQVLDLADVYSQTLQDLRQWREPPARGQIGTRGFLNLGWMAREIWGRDFINRLGDSTALDAERAVVLLSVYDRIKPRMAERQLETTNTRYELLRRGARHLDASGVISSGNLLIIAQSDPASPLPFPLEVEGHPVPGKGTTYYQFIVPLERAGAATQPWDTQPDEPSAETNVQP